MTSYRSLLVIPLCLLLVAEVHSANILAIYPTASYSHQMPMLSLARALAEKGHNLTVITPNPFETPIPNFTAIDISFTYNYWKSQGRDDNETQLIDLQSHYKSALQLINMFVGGCNILTDITLASSPIQRFIKYLDEEKPTFDLVLYEDFLSPAFSGFIHKIGHPPLVSLTTLPLLCAFDLSSGNICNPTHIADFMFTSKSSMTFWDRLYNSAMITYTSLFIRPAIYKVHNTIARKYFGADMPSLESIVANRSLLLASSSWMFEQARPVYSNTIHVGPLHIGSTKPLPEDLLNWISKGKRGFVYLSFGSNMKSASLDIATRSAILAAFNKFPEYQIIWKWEDENIEGLPANVLCRKWLPQHDLLAHPDIKLFITQGGLQSLQEGVHFKVPMIGIPFFADQFYNVEAILKLGVGSHINFADITTVTLHGRMNEILNNESYKKAAEKASLMLQTHILSPRDTAVWWVEYVLKFGGKVDHLRPDWWHLSWYQYLGLDLLLFILVAVVIVTFSIYQMITSLTRFLLSGKLKTQ